MATKMGRGSRFKPHASRLNFWGFFGLSGQRKRRGLGFKGLGSSVTCPGLHIPIDNFTIPHLNSKGAWRLGQNAQEGFESPLLCIFHTYTLKNSATSNS